MSIYDVFSGGGKPFNKEEWAAQKQAQRQEAYAQIETTCQKMVTYLSGTWMFRDGLIVIQSRMRFWYRLKNRVQHN